MKAPLLAATLIGAALFVTSNDAQAGGTASGFGAKGQLILSADRLVPLFGYTHSSVTNDNVLNGTREESSNQSGISLLFGRDLSGDYPGQPVDVHMIPRVAFDFTPINHLTIGLGLAFAFGLGGSIKTTTVGANANITTTTSADAANTNAIGVAPRVGWVIPLGEHFAFWPRAGFGFYSVHASTDNGNGLNAKVTDTTFSLDLDPQFVMIPTEHFFITLGPLLNIPLTGNRSTDLPTQPNRANETNEDTSLLHFGINAGIGGWIDL